MLHLQSESTKRWLGQVDENLAEVLIDHAHCERKAATTAMNLMNSYTENRQLCVEMTRIVGRRLTSTSGRPADAMIAMSAGAIRAPGRRSCAPSV